MRVEWRHHKQRNIIVSHLSRICVCLCVHQSFYHCDMLTWVQLTSASCLHVIGGLGSFEDDLEEIQILNFYSQHCTMGKCTRGWWPQSAQIVNCFTIWKNLLLSISPSKHNQFKICKSSFTYLNLLENWTKFGTYKYQNNSSIALSNYWNTSCTAVLSFIKLVGHIEAHYNLVVEPYPAVERRRFGGCKNELVQIFSLLLICTCEYENAQNRCAVDKSWNVR